MSWDSYINQLKENPCVMDAAICGSECGTVWASSSGLANISRDEIKTLAGDKSARKSLTQNGVYIGGQRCRLLQDRLEDESTYMMQLKTAPDSEGNSYGMSVGKTLKAFVIVKGTKEASGGQVSEKTYKVVDHLRKASF